MEKITYEFDVDYPSVRLELLKKRRFLMCCYYVGAPCAFKRCAFPQLTCSKCIGNMFIRPFPDVYINYMNLL